MSSAIAKIHASLSNHTVAGDWLTQASAAGQQIDREDGQVEALLFLAMTSIHQAADSRAAELWLDDGLSMAAAMQQDYAKEESLITIAYGASKLSNETPVRSLVQEVIEISTTIDNHRARANVLGTMANIVATMVVGEETNE